MWFAVAQSAIDQPARATAAAAFVVELRRTGGVGSEHCVTIAVLVDAVLLDSHASARLGDAGRTRALRSRSAGSTPSSRGASGAQAPHTSSDFCPPHSTPASIGGCVPNLAGFRGALFQRGNGRLDDSWNLQSHHGQYQTAHRSDAFEFFPFGTVVLVAIHSLCTLQTLSLALRPSGRTAGNESDHDDYRHRLEFLHDGCLVQLWRSDGRYGVDVDGNVDADHHTQSSRGSTNRCGNTLGLWRLLVFSSAVHGVSSVNER